MLSNSITVCRNQEAASQIASVAMELLKICEDEGTNIDIPEAGWMPILLNPEAVPSFIVHPSSYQYNSVISIIILLTNMAKKKTRASTKANTLPPLSDVPANQMYKRHWTEDMDATKDSFYDEPVRDIHKTPTTLPPDFVDLSNA